MQNGINGFCDYFDRLNAHQWSITVSKHFLEFLDRKICSLTQDALPFNCTSDEWARLKQCHVKIVDARLMAAGLRRVVSNVRN